MTIERTPEDLTRFQTDMHRLQHHLEQQGYRYCGRCLAFFECTHPCFQTPEVHHDALV